MKAADLPTHSRTFAILTDRSLDPNWAITLAFLDRVCRGGKPCRMSNKRLAEVLRLPIRTLAHHLAQLQKAGRIQIGKTRVRRYPFPIREITVVDTPQP